MSLNIFDWLFIISGVIYFLSIIGIFISVKKGREKLVRGFGTVMLSLMIPLSLVFINYLLIGQELWIMIFMILILAYLVVELLLDYIFKIDFRTKASRHIPYIILEYIACFGFIGISFNINENLGWLMSILFWAMLASLIYLYWGKKKELKT